MKFDPNARRCSYCGRWGSEFTCRGCGGPHSPDDDRALVKRRAVTGPGADQVVVDYAEPGGSIYLEKGAHPMTDELGRVIQMEAALKRSVVPSVIVTHDEYGNEIEYESFAAYNRAIERGRGMGLINWRA